MNRIYIALKEQVESKREYNPLTGQEEWVKYQLEPLGFGSSTNKKGVFNEVKVKKQLMWAYGGAYKEVNGIIEVTTREWDYQNRKYINVVTKPAEHQPLILDNTPVAGFKIEKIATRWTTANKLFRVSDPRGFELEIPAKNLLELLNSCTITKGEVIGKCIWEFGKNGIGSAKLIWVED